ncbi:carbohydrate-binding protein [Clostridium sp. BNL1100]|uniref:carbohydrate-binding protein n=1 Tax=Clostridium sp. BNL1100 TaxID=755731 RepID=UPI00024A76AA|nr:carbohydrate-binding protein [Clostridium sp. BNL1100]AEY65175.1 beta-galactosidase/beta-glucuronidase [Clostridium sp. BNL1100]
MWRKKILCIFLVTVLMLTMIPIPQQTVMADTAGLKELKGTDICNGLRGQSFNEGWKFNKGDVTNGQSISFNDGGWSGVTLPHDWSIYNTFNQSSAAGGGGGYLDGGIGWYRKTFTIPSDYTGKKVFIEFDGAYMNSQVWINGTLLGTRPYGYSSFEYDLTPYLNIGGSNVIAVRLNNNQPTSRWYSGSGIYRNVWLTVLDPVHVGYCGMFVTTPAVSSSSATANVSTKILNQGSTAKSVSLKTTITDAEGNAVASNTSSASSITGGSSNTFSQNLTVTNPHLWSPASPYLYTVQTQVIVDGNVSDTYSSTLGIRYFNFSSTSGFSLNGVNMKINGVCLHHDLGALGAAVNYRAIERELQIMKDMGCNAIRTSHNPPDPQMLEICDRLGLMVMDEAFDCWETGKTTNDYHLYFNNWAQTDLQAMVTRDRNHPSIIMYGIGNEIPSPTVATATKLKNWVKDIDSTRPVTWGCFAADMGDATHQSVASALDLVGYNYFPYTYDSGHNSHPEWKMFGSETSSAVRSRGVYKTPTNKNILTDTDNQCSSYDNSVVSWGNSAESSYNEINKRNYMAGEFVWTGFDYIGEPTPYGWPAKSSYFGIVDTCGFPKDIYYFYQSKWSTKPMVHILPHWNWSAGTNVEVWAYSNCDTVELFLNGTSLGSKTVGTAGHLSWSVPWSSGTLRAKGTKGGTVVYDEVVTAGAPSKVLLKPDRTSVKADGKDLIYIETDIADSKNVTVPTADNAVNFSISGPGVIVGVDNGNSISTESYKGNSRKAFSGKCLVIVQPTKVNGTIVVTASSNGLASASVSINSTGGAEAPILSAYKQIEAESYDNQSGIQTESCSEGGQDVGYIENGDYTVYNNVDFGSGAEGFVARVASATSGGNIEIRLDSPNGTLVGTCPVAGNGDWQTYTDVKCSVSGVSGKHDLYLKFTGDSGYLFNLNWFTFTAKSSAKLGDLNSDDQIDAIDFQLMKKYLLGQGNIENTKLADLDASGTIDVLDLMLLKQYLLGTITSFPGQGA